MDESEVREANVQPDDPAPSETAVPTAQEAQKASEEKTAPTEEKAAPAEEKTQKTAVPVESKAFRNWMLFFAALFLAVMLILNWAPLSGLVSTLIYNIRALLLGLALAYVLFPILRFFEKKVFPFVRNSGMRRFVSVLCTTLTALALLFLIIWMIFPQLIDSIFLLVRNFSGYLRNGVDLVNSVIEFANRSASDFSGGTLITPLDAEAIESEAYAWPSNIQNGDVKDLVARVYPALSSALRSTLFTFAEAVVSGVIAILILSVYDRLLAMIKRLARAVMNDKVYGAVTHFNMTAHRSFGGFLQGKIVDSLIIGVLTYILVSLFRIPYALLVATFVGITNIIPVIGPFIGAIPTAFIILLAEPQKALIFVILIILIQQLDGNVIGPAILGGNTGVSSLCVMIAIAVMGNIWGLIGMLVGVPIFATVLALIEERIEHRLHVKGVPMSLESYYPHNSVVEPERDKEVSSDSWMVAFEKRIQDIERRVGEGKEKPTRREKGDLRLHRVLRRIGLLHPLTPEQQTKQRVREIEAEMVRRTSSAAQNGEETV